MIKKLIARVFGLLIILLFSMNLSAQAKQTFRKYNARVNVYVKGKGGDKFKKEIRSYLIEELRTLSDVVIGEESSEWELIILAQELKAKTGEITSIVLSTNVNHFKDIHNRSYYRNIKGWESTNNEDRPSSTETEFELELNSPVVYIFKSNWQKPGAQEEFKEICRQIIVDFNSIYLDEDRRSFQEMIKSFQKYYKIERE